nr:hypothetical protein [uncultured Allomuricauda sp.]
MYIMQRSTIIILILIQLLISCDFRTPEEYYDLAYDKIAIGNCSEAIDLLDKAIQKRPEFRPGLLQRGFCKMEMQQDLDAIKDFDTILTFDPGNTLTLFNLGICYYNLSEYAKSIQYFSMAMQTVGSNSNDTVQIELQLLSDVDNDSNYLLYENEIRFERGCSFAKNGEFEKAIDDFNNVLSTNYKEAECYYWMGYSSMGLTDSIQACQYFSRSADLGWKESKDELKQICSK